MRKLLSIFMSVVMVVTMLPKVSFAEEQSAQQNEECPMGGVQDALFWVVGFVEEKVPEVWDWLKPYVEQGKTWGKDYYKSASEFANKVGKIGVLVTVVSSAIVCKIVYKVGGFVTRIIWPVPKADPSV